MPPDEFVAEHGISRLYHFTDSANIDSIKAAGGLFSCERLDESGIEIPKPGGNEWSHDADERWGLHRYVHLCFHAQHPMAFVAEQAGRIANVKYLEIRPEILRKEGVLYTADVSNKAGVELMTLDEAIELPLDFEVMFTRTDWRDPAVQARLRAVRKYEILVPDSVPLRYITNI